MNDSLLGWLRWLVLTLAAGLAIGGIAWMESRSVRFLGCHALDGGSSCEGEHVEFWARSPLPCMHKLRRTRMLQVVVVDSGGERSVPSPFLNLEYQSICFESDHISIGWDEKCCDPLATWDRTSERWFYKPELGMVEDD